MVEATLEGCDEPLRRPLRQPHVVGGFEQLGLQQQRTVVGGDQVEAPIQRRRAIEARRAAEIDALYGPARDAAMGANDMPDAPRLVPLN